MKRFVQGDSRTQSFLLPEALGDYVTDTNPVRVVDVFVDELDLRQLGFEGVEPSLTGRPSYHRAHAGSLDNPSRGALWHGFIEVT
jgi:transposase